MLQGQARDVKQHPWFAGFDWEGLELRIVRMLRSARYMYVVFPSTPTLHPAISTFGAHHSNVHGFNVEFPITVPTR